MKMNKYIAYVVILIAAFIGIGSANAELYGEKISKNAITPIGDIVKDPKSYNGKTVIVKGKIAVECPTGCWFDLKEGNFLLHVDINPSGFAIPQKVGKAAIVEGDISIEDGKTTLIGKGVDLR